MNNFNIAELYRLLSNIIRYGVVVDPESLDPPRQCPADRVIVDSNGIITRPLAWLTTKADHDRSWWKPEPGAQVLILSPGGMIENAVVLPAMYQNDYPAPADSPDVFKTAFKDGAVIEYNRKAHDLKVTLPDGGTTTMTSPGQYTINAAGGATINAAAGCTINGDTTINGKLHVTQPITTDDSVTAAKEVSDGKGSLSKNRSVFNGHNHGDGPKPNQQQ